MLTFLLVLIVLLVGFFLKRIVVETVSISGYRQKAILITGCDSGFGYDLAMKCLRNGMAVFATCLTEEGCENLRMQSGDVPGHLDSFVMDVRFEGDIAAALEHVKRAAALINKGMGILFCVHGIYGLVNNAGVTCAPLPDDLLTIDDYKRIVDVNTFGVIRVTHAFKAMIKEQRRELSAFGVSVSAIEPGFFTTPLVNKDRLKKMLDNGWNKAGEEQRRQYGEEFLAKLKQCTGMFLERICSPHTEWVIDAYFHALTSKFPRARYYVGNDVLFGFLPLSYLPSSVADKLLLIAAHAHGAPKPCVLS
ncbi:Retinol dehydrogenase 16 [Toxocara canis]|uniref:Retinol dehydrogenase 16 n=1 Tax=Toxocara canis TaxID=6265 RepID=A0A0B2VR27_TOXCA|nr:Retinol dehydrogenase 16 [Toxocara canis]